MDELNCITHTVRQPRVVQFSVCMPRTLGPIAGIRTGLVWPGGGPRHHLLQVQRDAIAVREHEVDAGAGQRAAPVHTRARRRRRTTRAVPFLFLKARPLAAVLNPRTARAADAPVPACAPVPATSRLLRRGRSRGEGGGAGLAVVHTSSRAASGASGPISKWWTPSRGSQALSCGCSS